MNIDNPIKSEDVRRKIPDSITRNVVPSSGNCLFEAIALALIRKAKLKTSHRQVRAQIVAHLRKKADEYEIRWDKKDHEGKPCDTWEKYLQGITKPNTKGGALEVAAAAKHWNMKIYIFLFQFTKYY